MHFAAATTASLFLLSSGALSFPLNTTPNPALAKRADPVIEGCTDDQKTAITTALSHVGGLAVYAIGLLSESDTTKWSTNNGWKHYFKDSDHDQVLKAYQALEQMNFAFKVRCLPQDQCPSGSFAFADALPESYSDGDNQAGTRYLNICPPFFSDPRTTRALPPFGDQPAIDKFCEFKESKKIADFETGGHTLLHELSHLDTFGIAAGYPSVHHTPDKVDPLEYDYHGTVDWKNNSTPGNARTLKTSSARTKPETWQNAESLAASATEMRAMAMCGLADIPL